MDKAKAGQGIAAGAQCSAAAPVPFVRPRAARMCDVTMFSFRRECPVCSTSVTDWSTRCPKCRYHPDCDPQPYNRAQDDVAMLVRYGRAESPRTPVVALPGEGRGWRRIVPAWLRGPGVA
jgi:hypothetical protein